MNDLSFKDAAWILAEKTPLHLGKPTLPPQGWRVEGADLVVLLADGRKVRGPIADQKKEKGLSAIKQSITITDLPVHKPSSLLGKKK